MIGYILVVLMVFGRALLPPDGQMIFGDDIHRQYYFFRRFFNEWIGKGVFPWWNPYLFGGEPFLANPVVNIWYPVNWLFILLPLPVAYGWHLAIHVLWAMAGMKKLTKSWIAGLIFGLSGFFAARIFAGHVDVIAAASWMPWVVWAFSSRGVLLASFVFAMQLLAGYQTMAFFTLIAALFMVRPITKIALGALGGLGLAGFHILPVQEFFRSSIRTYDLPYEWHSYGAIEWKSLLQLLSPFQFGNQYTYTGPAPNFIEQSMYVGVGGLILALFGIKKSLPFFFVLLFGLWLSLGPNAPVDLQYLLWKFVPMYKYLRIPARHLVLVVFGLSGLAGVGFRSLRLPKSLKGLTIGIVTLEMLWFARGFIEMRPTPETRHDKDLIQLVSGDSRILQNFGVWVPERDVLDFDSVMSYGIFSATGYDPSILRSYYEYVSGGKGREMMLSHDVQIPYITDPKVLDRLNIKYVLTPSNLYENKTVKPRFYLDGTVIIKRYTPNEIVLEVDSQQEQPLHSSEVWYPGWVAFVDGKKTDITKENDVFRTLFISAGKHTIVYRYSPRIFVIGLGISGITALVLWRFRRASI